MLMGEVCTRACRFCHVKVGAPPPLDPHGAREPGPGGEGAGPRVHRGHLGEPRRPAGRRREPLRRGHPRAAAREPEDHRRGAHPRLQGRGEATWTRSPRPGRTWSPTTSRRWSGSPPRCATAAPPTASRSRVLEYLKEPPGEALHQELDHGRPGRDRRGAGADLPRPARGRAWTCSRWASTSSRRSTTCAWSASSPRQSSTRYKQLAEAMGFLYVASGPLVRSQLPRRRVLHEGPDGARAPAAPD